VCPPQVRDHSPLVAVLALKCFAQDEKITHPPHPPPRQERQASCKLALRLYGVRYSTPISSLIFASTCHTSLCVGGSLMLMSSGDTPLALLAVYWIA
jgi:hypothetical protein